MANQLSDAQDAPAHWVQAPAETSTISGPVEVVSPQMTRPWGQESLDYAQSDGDAQRRTAEADRAADLDLDLWVLWISDVKQLTIQVWTRWILMDVHHNRTGARTMADVIFNLREG